ncbi:hypothetical protein [Burkholderia ambifaria]|uniref:hypothetical protein n=1 Tax=Burkholderia ambifaria TaxID=152480 RepID=UPI001FC80E0B|nr:hypothetical protein [Burkholderia ambifaria]
MTPAELTKHKFESWVDKDPRSAFLGTGAPIESTRIERNRVPLTDPRFKWRPVVPEFDAPTEDELRALWREYTDLQVRWLILDIRTLRKSLERIEEWYAYTDKNVAKRVISPERRGSCIDSCIYCATKRGVPGCGSSRRKSLTRLAPIINFPMDMFGATIR